MDYKEKAEGSMISETYNEDCMATMARFPDKFFDLAVVDPPYGINAGDMNMGSNPKRSRADGHGSGPSVSTVQRLKGRLNQGSGKLKNRLLNKSAFGWDNSAPGPEYFSELFRVSKHQIIWGATILIYPLQEGLFAGPNFNPGKTSVSLS